jgi:hypothetical protein
VYSWDPNYLQMINAWNSGAYIYNMKFKAIQCGNTTVVFKGAFYNNHYKITVTCPP